MRQLHPLLSYTVIGLSLLVAMQLYVYAPWHLDPLAFLARPLILFVLPLLGSERYCASEPANT